jgi:hypothetical protein
VNSVVLWILFEFNEKIHFASVLFVFLVSILCARSGFVGSLWISMFGVLSAYMSNFLALCSERVQIHFVLLWFFFRLSLSYSLLPVS